MWLAFLLALAPTDVLDVDAVQGPYFEIQAAIDAAQSGDVVRVGPGDYASIHISGKGLTLLGTGAVGDVRVAGKVHIEAVPVGETVVVEGLRADLGPVIHPAGLFVDRCLGSVRVARCEFIGDHHGGAWISHSHDVTLHDVVALASPTLSRPAGGAGLNCFYATVAAWSCEFRGNEATLRGLLGGAGVFAYDSTLTLVDVDAQGGRGGPDGWHAPSGTCYPAGNGGPGVEVWQATMTHLDCRLVGGQAGPATQCPPQAAPGQPILLTGVSSATGVTGGAPRLSCPGLALEATAVTLAASGDPGDTIVLVVGPDAGRHGWPGVVGPLCVGGPLAAVRRAGLGVGAVNAPLQLPALAPFGVEALHLQTLHLRPGGAVFGPPRVLTVLDSAW